MNNQVKECFHDWIENLQKVRNLSDNTLTSYKNDIEKFLIFSKDHFGGNLSISDLDRMQISDFRSFLSFLRNRGIGTTSIARVISSLKSFFNFLVKNEIELHCQIVLIPMENDGKHLLRTIMDLYQY